MHLELQRFTDPIAFRDAVDAYLRANLNACSQLFAITKNLTEEQARDRKAWLVRLHRSGQTCGIALISTAPPQRLLNVSSIDDEGAALIVAAVAADGIAVNGLHGSVHTVSLLAKHVNGRASERTRMGNHVLDMPPQQLPRVGRMRAATLEDYDLLLAWESDFVL